MTPPVIWTLILAGKSFISKSQKKINGKIRSNRNIQEKKKQELYFKEFFLQFWLVKSAREKNKIYIDNRLCVTTKKLIYDHKRTQNFLKTSCRKKHALSKQFFFAIVQKRSCIGLLDINPGWPIYCFWWLEKEFRNV